MGIFRDIIQENNTSIRSHSKVDITENRAPTDESLRLLQEMQNKALLSIVKTLPVINNNVTFVISQSQDPLEMGRWFVKVTLNGVEKAAIINNNFKDSHELAEEISQWFASLFYKEFLEGIFRSPDKWK